MKYFLFPKNSEAPSLSVAILNHAFFIPESLLKHGVRRVKVILNIEDIMAFLRLKMTGHSVLMKDSYNISIIYYIQLELLITST